MPPPVTRMLIAVTTLLSCGVLQADQNLGNPGRPPEQPGFFHRASDSIGGFFRRVFGSDEEAQQQKQQQQQPRYGTHGTDPKRHSLDQPPASARYTAPSGNSGTRTIKEQDMATQKNVAGSGSQNHKTQNMETEAPRQKSKGAHSVGETIAPKTERKPPPQQTPPPVIAENNSSTVPASSGKVLSNQEPAPSPKASQDQNVLTGTKTNKAGRVKSPYPPNSELDVSGLASGSLALDPTTQKIFRVP